MKATQFQAGLGALHEGKPLTITDLVLRLPFSEQGGCSVNSYTSCLRAWQIRRLVLRVLGREREF